MFGGNLSCSHVKYEANTLLGAWKQDLAVVHNIPQTVCIGCGIFQAHTFLCILFSWHLMQSTFSDADIMMHCKLVS